MRREVLDHGYVELVEAWGTGKDGVEDWRGRNDEPLPRDFEVGVIEAARQSTQGSFRGWSHDQRLLTYLHEHRHASPFEFAGMVVEVRAPIFVFREWHRHRTQSYNEASARYSALPDFDYAPTVERLLAPTDGPNKQASRKEGTEALTREGAEQTRQEMLQVSHILERWYQIWLDRGVPKELARVRLPVGRYSQMRAAANLRNWLLFLDLRTSDSAQWEIRQYAWAISDLIEAAFPKTHELWRASRG